MILSLVAAPAETPVSLTEAKAHVRVDGTDEDALLTMYLDAAVAHLDGAEGVLGRCMVTQTWDYTTDTFPKALPLPALQSVTSITYRDADGAEQTLAAEDYMVSGQVLTYPDGPPATDGYPGAVTVRFVAGYGDATDVPAALKAAILLYVGDLYANREARGEQLFDNPAAAALIRPYKRVRV